MRTISEFLFHALQVIWEPTKHWTTAYLVSTKHVGKVGFLVSFLVISLVIYKKNKLWEF